MEAPPAFPFYGWQLCEQSSTLGQTRTDSGPIGDQLESHELPEPKEGIEDVRATIGPDWTLVRSVIGLAWCFAAKEHLLRMKSDEYRDAFSRQGG